MTKHCSFLSILALLTSITGVSATQENKTRWASSEVSGIQDLKKLEKYDLFSVQIVQLPDGSYLFKADSKSKGTIFSLPINNSLNFRAVSRSSSFAVIVNNHYSIDFNRAKVSESLVETLNKIKKEPAKPPKSSSKKSGIMNQAQLDKISEIIDQDQSNSGLSNPTQSGSSNTSQSNTLNNSNPSQDLSSSSDEDSSDEKETENGLNQSDTSPSFSNNLSDKNGQPINTNNDGNALTNFFKKYPKSSVGIGAVAAVTITGIIGAIVYSKKNVPTRRKRVK